MSDPHGPPPTEPRLRLLGISKIYPSVVANADVDLAVMPGEIHAVLGENGAGKSTLMKMIYGVTKPDAGEIMWEGRQVRIDSPSAARRLGIGMVFQHFALFETLTVAENIALALDDRTTPSLLAPRIRAVSEQYGLPLDPDRLVHSMSVRIAPCRSNTDCPSIRTGSCIACPSVLRRVGAIRTAPRSGPARA